DDGGVGDDRSRLASQLLGDGLEFRDDLRAGHQAVGAADRITDAVQATYGDDATERTVLTCTARSRNIDLVGVRSPSAKRGVKVMATLLREGSVDRAVVDAGPNETLVVASGQLARKVLVVAVSNGRDV